MLGVSPTKKHANIIFLQRNHLSIVEVLLYYCPRKNWISILIIGVNILGKLFANLTPDEIATLSLSLGLALAKPLTLDELRVLGNVLSETAEVLLVIAAQRAFLEAQKTQQNQNSTHDLQAQIQHLQNQIDHLKAKIG